MLTKANQKVMMTNTTYDFGKKLVQVILPATSALYFGLAQIWGLPAAEEVVGTIAIITTFLGVILGVSNRQYETSGAAYDGRMVVAEPEDGPQVFSLELDGDPADLVSRDSIRFKIDPHQGDGIPVIDDSL